MKFRLLAELQPGGTASGPELCQRRVTFAVHGFDHVPVFEPEHASRVSGFGFGELGGAVRLWYSGKDPLEAGDLPRLPQSRSGSSAPVTERSSARIFDRTGWSLRMTTPACQNQSGK